MPIKRGFASVAFDEMAWHEDLRQAAGSAKRIGEETRFRLEREGQAVDALFACDKEARDGTSLPGCVKVYLPPPGGPLGLVFRLAKGKDGGSISTIWHSACGTCPQALVEKPSTGSRIAAYTVPEARSLTPPESVAFPTWG